ncbi:MAG: hypothetical protein P4M11_12375 [Candidatus Pacebacteria bacterium]|nr:hypothetical protein [Candidatus Paceibacterota bacterium]
MIYTNIVFYSNYTLAEKDPAIFTILLSITIFGYYIFFETTIVLLVVVILIVYVCFVNRDYQQMPISTVLSHLFTPTLRRSCSKGWGASDSTPTPSATAGNVPFVSANTLMGTRWSSFPATRGIP